MARALFRSFSRPQVLGFAAAVALTAAMGAEAPKKPEPAAETQAGMSSAQSDALYEIGRHVFEQYAPADVKAEYDYPTKEQWDASLPKLQSALQSETLAELAAYAPQARAALATLRAANIDPGLADWLEQRLDEAEAAKQATEPARPTRPSRPSDAKGSSPAKPPAPSAMPNIPYYSLWLSRVQSRPKPARADELMPMLQRVFSAEGIPPEFAWMAEAESTLNPAARSPAGARGLFQLMPETAKSLGLDTFLPDERTDPEKSARAAARHLRELRARFGSWPLAFAAYNAGAGRVSRALAAEKAKDFAGIAEKLPAETRMYVPKVYALAAVRSGRAELP